MAKRFTGRIKERKVKAEKQAKSDGAKVKASDTTGDGAAKQDAKPALIKVLKKDAKFRGAREAWYKRLVEFDGKPLDAYIEDCKKNCPQLTKNSTPENPTGWVGFFKRQGIMQVSQE